MRMHHHLICQQHICLLALQRQGNAWNWPYLAEQRIMLLILLWIQITLLFFKVVTDYLPEHVLFVLWMGPLAFVISKRRHNELRN